MERVRTRFGSLADSGVRLCVYGAILVLPLAYWPTLGLPHTVPKIGLLWVLAAWGFALWVLRVILWRQGAELRRLPLILPFLMLVLSFALSCAFSLNEHLSVFGNYYRKEGLFTFLAYLSFYPMVATTFRTRKEILSLVESMLLASFLCGLIGFSQVLGLGFGPPMTIDQRISSTFGNANFSGQFFAISSLLALGLVLLYRGGWRKLLALCAFGLNLFCLLETYTRGAWIAFGLAILLVTILGARMFWAHNRSWVSGIVVLVILSLLLTYSLPGTPSTSLLPRLQSLFSDRTFFSSRGIFWQQGLNVAVNYPLLGSGPETFRLAFRPFISPAYVEREGSFDTYSNLDRAHNELLDVAAMRGGVGLVVYLFFLASLLWRWRQGWRGSSEREHRGLLLVLLGGWSAYLIADMFNFGMAGTTPYFWILSGAVASSAFFGRTPPQKKAGEGEGPTSVLGPEAVPLQRKTLFWWWFPLVVLCSLVTGLWATYQATLLLAADANYGQALQLRRQGDKAQAVQLSERATELNPMEGQYWLGLGIAQIDLALTQTDTDQKIQWLQAAREPLATGQALTDQPELAWNNIGISYMHEAACWGSLVTGQLTTPSRLLLEKARGNFLACLQFDRNLPPSWLLLSQVDTMLGRWQEAREAATTALTLHPTEWVEVYLAKAKAEIGLGDFAAAKQSLKTLLEKDPLNPEAQVLWETMGVSP